MKSKKEILSHILCNARLMNLFKRLPFRNKLIVLNYHRILPSGHPFRTPFDDGVYSVNEAEFARQINWLKHNTLILSEDDLIKLRGENGFALPQTSTPCVVITFDDGYKDNYTAAFPILKYFEVPAIFFVATQMIDTRQLFWWDIIAYLIKHSRKPFIVFNDVKYCLPDQQQEAIFFFHQRMKLAQYEQTKYLIPELSNLCEIDVPMPPLQDEELLTWKEIEEMAEHQIAIGSHTHTHRVLSTISSNSQKEEMLLSKLIIEKHIGNPVRSISYPVGELQFITSETSQIAAASGYLLGFTANTGVNEWKKIHSYKINRVAHLLEKVSTLSLLTILPELFTWDSATILQKKKRTFPTHDDAYYRLGSMYLGQGNIDLAINNFQEALHCNPDYTDARIKLGVCQAYAGRYPEAENNLKIVLKKHPGFADIHYYYGIVHAIGRNIPMAVQDFNKAVEINPHNKNAFVMLAVLYGQQQEYSLALNMLERASQLDDSDTELKEGVTVAQQAILSHSISTWTLNSIVTSYFGLGDCIEDVISGFVGQIEIGRNLHEVIAIVEKGDFQKKNLEPLLDFFLEYKFMFPKYTFIHNILGLLYHKLGRMKDAKTSFEEALRLNPNYMKARNNLSNLSF